MLSVNRKPSPRQKSSRYDLRRKVLMKNFLKTQAEMSTSQISQGNITREISSYALRYGPQSQRRRVLIAYPKVSKCKCMNPVETKDVGVQTIDPMDDKENVFPISCQCHKNQSPIIYPDLNFADENFNLSRRLRTSESGKLREPVVMRNRKLVRLNSRPKLQKSTDFNNSNDGIIGKENREEIKRKKLFHTPSLKLKKSFSSVRKGHSAKLVRTNSKATQLKHLSEYSHSIKRKNTVKRRTSLRRVFQQVLSSQPMQSNDLFSTSDQVPSLENSRNQSLISKLFKIGKKPKVPDNTTKTVKCNNSISQEVTPPRRTATILRSRSLHEHTRTAPPVLRNRRRSHSVRVPVTKIRFS